MKKQVSAIILAVMCVWVLMLPATAVDAQATQVLQLKKELVQLRKQYHEYLDKEHIHVVMGNIYTTSPQYIVEGYGFGTEGFMNNAKYYIIDDPQNGEVRLYFYQGLHSYLGMTTIKDKNGKTVPAMRFGAVSAECYRVRAALYDKEAQYEKLTGRKMNYDTVDLNVLNHYADQNVMVFQIGNPDMNAYT